jgi:hypothetical protein
MNEVKAVLLDEHPIHGVIHTAKGELKPFPILAIDDLPLNQWMNQFMELKDDLSILSLVPAQGWLIDEPENKAAWTLLKTTDDQCSSAIVPLLICPDDLDLTCTTLVVEQVQMDSKIIWKRFGQAVNEINAVVSAVDWWVEDQSFEFERKAFDAAIAHLIELDQAY